MKPYESEILSLNQGDFSMDNSLLHRFLDLGIAVAQSLALGDVAMEVEAESQGLGVVSMDMDTIAAIIAPVITWEEADARAMFEYILDCIVQFNRPPNAFMLADLIHTRYQRRVDGTDDMGDCKSQKTIPH